VALSKAKNDSAAAWSEKEKAGEQLRKAKEQIDTLKDKLRREEDDTTGRRGAPGLGAGAKSYTDLAAKVKELEEDKHVLESQKKTVLALNPSTGSFEYIGEPVALSKDGDLNSVPEVVSAMKVWLKRPGNDRLSVLQIFEGLDLANAGEVRASDFESAMARLGVRLAPKELQALKEVLDPHHVGYLSYRPLVRELLGVPQLDFMHKVVIKLARVVVDRDLTQPKLLTLIDLDTQANMTLDAFQSSMNACKAPDFNFSVEEVTALFRCVTGAAQRT